MKFLFLIALSLIITDIFPQQEITAGGFFIKQNGNVVEAFSGSGSVYHKEFSNPNINTIDLDGDGIEEIVVVDSSDNNYAFFIFNTIDDFSLIDSISSGAVYPYISENEEAAGIIIIAGNTEMLRFNNGAEIFLPLNVWKYDAGELHLINDEIYDIFISENEMLLNYLESEFSGRGDCGLSIKLKGVITAAYVNYLNAGESSFASHLIKKYYLCDDAESFKIEINNLLFKEAIENENGLE